MSRGLRPLKWVALCLLPTFFFFGCGGPKNFVVLTDQIQLADLMEPFQLQHPEIVVEIHYQENVGEAFKSRTEFPDLVVAKGLLSEKILSQSQALDKIFPEAFARENYFPVTFNSGLVNESLRAIVLSFDLPLVLVNAPRPRHAEDFFEKDLITLESLRDESLQFIKKTSRGDLKNLGFSLFSNQDFYKIFLRYNDVVFSTDFSGNPIWDNEKLSSALNALKSWTLKAAVKSSQEIEYLGRIKGMSDATRINQGILKYALMNASDFFGTNRDQRENTSSAWLSTKQKILAHDNMVSTLIPNASNNKGIAKDAILFLLDPQNQEKAIRSSQNHFGKTFGFLSGFPTNQLQYELTIPAAYTYLRGHLPPISTIEFPTSSFDDFDNWVRNVLNPYVRAYIESEKMQSSIRDMTNLWIKQRGKS